MSNALVGVPVQTRKRVLEKYTVPGALGGAAARWAYNEALNRNQGILAVETALTRFAQDGLTNPYHTQLGTDLYRVSLGDADDVMPPGSATPATIGTSGSWADVAKVFVGQVGAGIGTRIGGGPGTTVIQAPAPSGPPKWLVPVAIGGGVLLLGALLLRRKS